jgi:hypothetical protein
VASHCAIRDRAVYSSKATKTPSGFRIPPEEFRAFSPSRDDRTEAMSLNLTPGLNHSHSCKKGGVQHQKNQDTADFRSTGYGSFQRFPAAFTSLAALHPLSVARIPVTWT